jgi:hypothetical protein
VVDEKEGESQPDEIDTSCHPVFNTRSMQASRPDSRAEVARQLRWLTIEPAALGAQRLLVGAVELAWDGLIADPISVAVPA